jgi:hypothetical protein
LENAAPWRRHDYSLFVITLWLHAQVTIMLDDSTRDRPCSRNFASRNRDATRGAASGLQPRCRGQLRCNKTPQDDRSFPFFDEMARKHAELPSRSCKSAEM